MFAGFFTALEEDDFDLEDMYDCDCEICVEYRAEMDLDWELDLIQESELLDEFEFEEYWYEHDVNPCDVFAADSADVSVLDNTPRCVEYSIDVDADSWSVTV